MMTSASTPSPSVQDIGFVHRFVPGTDSARRPLLLLHGTGGDENDLLPLGSRLAPGAALLSPRGKVNENGMLRFFRRKAEGVFDIEDMLARTDELAQFVEAARKHYGIAIPVALGFSNGANIAWSLLLRHPTALAGAILIRAMMPFEPDPGAGLRGTPVLMLSGSQDPLSTPAQRDGLARVLQAAGAKVVHETLPAGHQLTPQDLTCASEWLTGI